MRYLIVAPQLGYQTSGKVEPGGLLQFGRCIARAMGSFVQIKKLGIWCQADPAGVENLIERTVLTYAHASLELDIRAFANSRPKLATALAISNIRNDYDRVMYLLVNQASLSRLPFHPVYDVWEIGEELFLRKQSRIRQYSLKKSDRLLSISNNTSELAAKAISDLAEAKVVHLCLEPPLYEPELAVDFDPVKPYRASEREQAVMIVGNMHSNLLYKGHQQLIIGWPEVIKACPNAQLWIIGDGDGRSSIEAIANSLSSQIRSSISFLGRLDPVSLAQRYERCRVFAMPSTGEGFGLVFVEASRYGIPCIAGKHDSAKEIVLDGDSGLLVEQMPRDIAEACIMLLNDDQMAEYLGNNARQRYLNTFRFSHFRNRLSQALDFG